MDKTVSDRINEVKGTMSQSEFANSINSSQPVICKILNGEPPSINVLIAISQKYHISIDWLLGLSSRKSLNGYTTYDSEKNLTYSDAINVLNHLVSNNSVELMHLKDSFYKDDTDEEISNIDVLKINDSYLTDLLSSLTTLNSANPETIDVWLAKINQNYDLPILRWTEIEYNIYTQAIKTTSSLELLKQRFSQK